MKNFAMHLWRTLTSHKDAVALRTPSDEGVVEQTYAEWLRQLHRLAIGLMEEGLEPGERVGFVAQNTTDWLSMAIAAWAAGACLVPLVPGRDRRETLRCLARSGASWIVVRDQAGLDHIRGQAANLPDHLRWVALEGDRLSGVTNSHTLASLRESGHYRERRGGDKQLARRMFELDLQQPALILFEPEPGEDPHGAFFTGEACAKMLGNLAEDLRFEQGDRLAVILSYGWFHALLLSVAALLDGRTLVSADKLGHIIRDLAELSPTHLVCGPAFLEGQARRWRGRIEAAPDFLRKITEEGQGGSTLTRALSLFGERAAERTLYEPIREDLGAQLRSILVVGGRLPAEVLDVLERIDIAALGVHGYPEAGLTHMERLGAQLRDSVGRPIQGIACKIEGARGEQVGQILIRGEALSSGYWDDEGPRAMIDGWLHTGEEGVLRGGFLFVGDAARAEGASEEE